jgi:hypothetical protein
LSDKVCPDFVEFTLGRALRDRVLHPGYACSQNLNGQFIARIGMPLLKDSNITSGRHYGRTINC